MREIIRVNGVRIPLEARKYSFEEIYKLIGCDCVDLVHLADRVHVMVVDDNGLLFHKPVNREATLLYWEKCGGPTPTPIVGDVVIVPESDYADEEESDEQDDDEKA